MNSVACIMMQRDEDDLLAPWLTYHGYLFGFENLYVLDNGSSHPVTLETIRRFQKVGVNFDFTFTKQEDYELKGEITRSKINMLGAARKHDVFFPLDCDEFVVAMTAVGLTCCRREILAHMATLDLQRRGVLTISTLLYNVPGDPEVFYFQDQDKIFIVGGGVSHMEHGNHRAGIPGADPPRSALGLTYLHFHNRSFSTLKARSLMKLKISVDINDHEALLAFKGRGDHLIRYFTMSERDYLASFASKDLVVFPAFLNLLTALGMDAALRRATLSDIRGIKRTGDIFLAEFDGNAYWNANPDVAENGVPALLHYYQHGKREGRMLG